MPLFPTVQSKRETCVVMQMFVLFTTDMNVRVTCTHALLSAAVFIYITKHLIHSVLFTLVSIVCICFYFSQNVIFRI